MRKFNQWCTNTHGHQMTPDDENGAYYLDVEVDAHIYEMQRSHDVTTAMLKASLAEAQQAIQRMAVEAKAQDEKIRSLMVK